ncbi:hypothetical protein ACCO45_007512 [Purpureocillium lilacinum]|uniref:Uncharacterized protein n=1 Tax=Purpureocillium lilacinum TaxID=33203 RepID=A0ACC4DSK3_PURLI
MPVGSRRRRVALRSTTDLGLPFEQLPYQAFQEARAVLAADRADKLGQIRTQLGRIARLEGADPAAVRGGQRMRDTRLASLRRHVERLKILADANDPLVKKRFEDGLGDMNKPIYRHYAEKKWRAYDRRLIAQRIKQFSIVPDLLPKLDPTADVQLFFRRAKVPPAPSSTAPSASPPAPARPALRPRRAPRHRRRRRRRRPRPRRRRLLQALPLPRRQRAPQPHERLPAPRPPAPPGPARPPLAAPAAQKGSPYHRLAVVLLEQTPGQPPLDVDKLRALPRDGFSLKSLRDRFALAPFGFTMFRSVWDDNTAAVMARHAIPGADVELRPARVRSLKPPSSPAAGRPSARAPSTATSGSTPSASAASPTPAAGSRRGRLGRPAYLK